ncbi:MAG: patatin-like phospholipase family protein [Candidatus Lindowbacteria bacterium]|nr:patatin-like phospholipase family protein [Candidatus Lindowbacteria bacterium]
MTTSIKALKELPVFVGVSTSTIEKLLEEGEVFELKRGDTVLRAGQMLDHFYLVLAGRLTFESDKTKASLGRGETIGGLGLVGLAQSFFKVSVRLDAELLKIPMDMFHDIAASDPTFFTNIMKLSASHLGAIYLQETKTPSRIISVCSAPEGVGKTRLTANLAAALAAETGKRTLVIDVAIEKKKLTDFFSFGGTLSLLDLRQTESQKGDIVKKYGKVHTDGGFEILRVANHPNESLDAEGVTPLLSKLARDFGNIVIDLPPHMDETIWRFLQQSDTVITITSPENHHLDQTANLLQKLPSEARVILARSTERDFERLDEIENRLANQVDEILEEFEGDPDNLVYLTQPSSPYGRTIRRLARKLTGRAVGLALSGGAARGMGHIGVIKVLEEEGIYPDMITGTSIGALIGSMWALGHSSPSLERIARRIKRKDFFSILDLAIPPSPALLKGARVNAFIDRVFGNKQFSDLQIPLKITSTDIDTGESVVIDRGSVATAVRASVSIPGIFRPVERKGRALIDGAVVMPVPVRILNDMGVHKVIAVNSIPTPEAFNVPQRGTLRKILSPRTKKKPADVIGNVFDVGQQGIPNIFEIIVRANQFMESLIAVESCSNAQVVIRPWLTELHWLDFDASEKFIEEGVRATREALPDIKSLIES